MSQLLQGNLNPKLDLTGDLEDLLAAVILSSKDEAEFDNVGVDDDKDDLLILIREILGGVSICLAGDLLVLDTLLMLRQDLDKSMLEFRLEISTGSVLVMVTLVS